MAYAINLIGKKFGKLKVISRSKKTGNKKQIKWNCICDCGNKHLVTGESLRSGKSKSCGCLLRESRYIKNNNTDREKAMLKIVYSSMKKRHRNKFGNEDYISFNEFKKLSLSDCFYCNSKPSNRQLDIRYETRRGRKDKFIVTDFILKYNGIDRIDSEKGYIKENVVSCCKNCNTAKNILTQEQFKDLINRIYNYWASK